MVETKGRMKLTILSISRFLLFAGITDSDEIDNLKNHIVSRLATAYSLEKMRKALTKLRTQRERVQHLDDNEISDDDAHGSEKAKRVAIKKEKVEYDNSQ